MKEDSTLGLDSLTTRYRALVVEDSPVSMRAVANLIALQPGVEVVGTALDGNDGLQQARTLQPDIVFTDLEMPGPTGLELVQTLRQEFPRMRLVVISVHEGAGWAELSTKHGADAFVPKNQLAGRLTGLLWELFEATAPLVASAPGVSPTVEAFAPAPAPSRAAKPKK